MALVDLTVCHVSWEAYLKSVGILMVNLGRMDHFASY